MVMSRTQWVVRLPSWLGDTIMAVPTIRALGRSVSRLVLWGPEANCRLLRATGVNAEVLPYRRRRGAAGLIDMQRAVQALGSLRASGVVLLPNAYEPALIARLARVRRRVGYATQLRGHLLTDALPAPSPLEPVHESRRFAGLLAATPAGNPLADDWRLAAPADAAARTRQLLGAEGPILTVIPGCANGPAKRWPAPHFARAVEHAAQQWDAIPVLAGGPQDVEIAAEVEQACAVPCINLAGRTDILDLAALLTMSRTVIANDTGAAHLAAALSVPTLVLFGPTDPRRTKPHGPMVRVASIAAFCQPCLAAECPLDHRCMAGLTPDLVVTALEPLWNAG